MKALLHGALVEYSGAFLGPVPNIVVFQFNPEQIARTLGIAPRGGATADTTLHQHSEISATSGPPVESFTVNALFSAADNLGANNALSVMPRMFGVSPQLAALEKMVYPPKNPGGLIGKAIDAVGGALSHGSFRPISKIPRVAVPKLLFIWGTSRILPVVVTSMTITEKQFDFLLNPVEAEAAIGLEVIGTPATDEKVANGALTYTNMIKDTQATLNLANTVQMAADIVSF